MDSNKIAQIADVMEDRGLTRVRVEEPDGSAFELERGVAQAPAPVVVAPQVVAAEMAKYNGYCAAGKDEQFYKPACFLQPVAEGPFYAMQYEPSAWVTIGGIRTNDRLQAIDDAGIAIPGLYVAGADNGTLMSAPYCDYEGFSLMCAYSGGRMAGMYAAEAVA